MQNSDGHVHITTLKKIAQSPAHYQAALRKHHDTASMKLGRLLHFLLLGGDEIAVYDGSRRGKAWEEFEAANDGKEIFTASEVAKATPIAAAVRRHPVVQRYGLLEGECEKTILWQNMGRSCSSRLDVLNAEKRRIVDLKLARSSQPERFDYASRRLSYPAQGAWYRAAAASIGVAVDEVILLSVEPEDPYAVTAFRMTERLLNMGDRQCRLWMERLLACEAANDWPEYAQDIVELDVPEEDDGFELDWSEDDGEEAAAQ